MTDVRVENEVKLYSDGGPFSFDGDPSGAVSRLRALAAKAGVECGEHTFSRHVDDYYTDRDGTFERDGMILRFRDAGDRGYVTVKRPSVVDGMGLSRKEIETEVFLVPGFDRFAAVLDHSRRYLGTDRILPDPVVRDYIDRVEMPLRTEARRYTLDYDRIVYEDPSTGTRSVPVYELEIESLDDPIKDDVAMRRLISALTDDCFFREERVSKYRRGMAFVRSLRQ